MGPVHCSFCGKSSEEQRKIILAPDTRKSICEECIYLCNKIMSEHPGISAEERQEWLGRMKMIEDLIADPSPSPSKRTTT